MKIIGFGGQGRVGKTTAAKDLCVWMIRNTTSLTPILLPLAHPLKEAVAKEAGYENAEAFKEKEPELYRRLCQEIGGAKREEDPDYWVKKWDEARMEYTDNEKNYVIVVDDVRYPNEVDKVRLLGGLVHFVHPGNRILEDSHGAWREHHSEKLANICTQDVSKALDTFDGLVYNDTDLEDYYELLQMAYTSWLGITAQALLEEEEEE